MRRPLHLKPDLTIRELVAADVSRRSFAQRCRSALTNVGGYESLNLFCLRLARLPAFVLALFALAAGALSAPGQIRDGGIDPRNLGKGEWLYYMSSATNKLGGNVDSVTNEASLMLYLKSQGIRYIIVKAATSDQLFKGSYSFPQFTDTLVNTAHANDMLIFGYNRSYGSNIVREIEIADYVFQQGADGFVWDAEAEWENTTNKNTGLPDHPWITNGPLQAWQLCSTVRSNWPNKFLAHSPFAIISYHSSFPYKEFGYWCDAVMPQIYHFSVAGLKGSPSAAIEWTDVNWYNWQNSLYSLSPTNLNGLTVYWTNAIKPLVPINDVYGPLYSSPTPDEDVMEFIDYISADPNCVTPGGYQGMNFFRADLHGDAQWAYIKAATSGSFPGVVDNLVIDNPGAVVVGPWTSVRTFYNGAFYGGSTDTNSFGTNYLTIQQGAGNNYVQFTPNIVVPGDYEIYQWHPLLGNASARVPFVVSYYGGTTTVYANQQTNDGNWSSLGRFFFNAGAGSIRVTDAIAEAGRVAIVDGLKLMFVPPAAAPDAPIQLAASPVSRSQINLAWTDAATNATGFILARSTNSGGPYIDIGTVPARVTTFSDTGLAAEITYYYVVRATNFLGASANSAQAGAMTFPVTPVLGWGDNTWGQLLATTGTTNAIAVAAGGYHSLALRADGVVVAWGNNWLGQATVPPTLTNALAIAAGGYHSLAIKADGTVAAWGENDSGQTTVPAWATNIIAVAAGTWHSLALRANGTVVAWGENYAGQTTVPAGLTNIIAIAAGGRHSLALRADGTVAAWGENTDAWGVFVGQSIVPWNLTNVVAIAAGDYHSLALRANGTVVAWGDNSQAQCQVPNGLSNVVAVAGGGAHSLALRAGGTVAAWGAYSSGQCALPATLADVVAIAAGEVDTLVLLAGNLPVPRLLNPGWKGNQFSLLLQTLNRKNYALEYRNSLAATSWTALSTNTGNGALRMLVDQTTGTNQRFYRVRQWGE